jgi:hypothetical protein
MQILGCTAGWSNSGASKNVVISALRKHDNFGCPFAIIPDDPGSSKVMAQGHPIWPHAPVNPRTEVNALHASSGARLTRDATMISWESQKPVATCFTRRAAPVETKFREIFSRCYVAIYHRSITAAQHWWKPNAPGRHIWVWARPPPPQPSLPKPNHFRTPWNAHLPSGCRGERISARRLIRFGPHV